ncbi:hypothetical protein IQ65_18260 [Leptospira interrogans serovar Lai]|nr:hypothetical protein IQ65_18260 [Leptospira interrogans serovar Lai]
MILLGQLEIALKPKNVETITSFRLNFGIIVITTNYIFTYIEFTFKITLEFFLKLQNYNF